MYVKPLKSEAIFERDFAFAARILKCNYEKIKDARGINKHTRDFRKEVWRLCDGILILKTGYNYLIECKYKYNSLEPHQKATQDRVNRINNTFYVLRKNILKSGVIYTIEQPEKTVLLRTAEIEALINYFINLK